MSKPKDADVDRLTREEIELMRTNVKGAITNLWADASGRSIMHGKVDTLCDLALQSLSQEAVRDEALEEIVDEVQRATSKFPTWPTDPLHAVAVLGEEFGELTKAMLQLTYEPDKTSKEEVRKEALQTAAMALRLYASLDRYDYKRGPQHEQPALKREPNAAGWNEKGIADIGVLPGEVDATAAPNRKDWPTPTTANGPISRMPAPAAPVAEMVRRLRGLADSEYFRDTLGTEVHSIFGQAAALLAKLGQGWVPVSERLPKQGSSVLVLMDGKHHAIADVSQQNPDEPGFFVRGSFWRWDSATHWMPLPPAP